MTPKSLLLSVRPVQWTKNLFVFAALIFARRFFSLPDLLRTVAAFAVFCLVTSGMYLLNDLCDRHEDRAPPKKAGRPIASGKIRAGEALAAFSILALAGLAGAARLGFSFFSAVALYILLQVAYSVRLKRVVILDLFIVAAGFVIRVVAGGLAIDVPISSWLLICTTLLALLLSIGKRRHELVLLDDRAAEHRPILKEYSAHLLDQMIAVVTASTVIAYCLYTVAPETVQKFGTSRLVWTSGFVLYGIFRYLYLIHQKGKGGSPEELVIQDKPLLLDILLWGLSVILVIYFK